MARKRVLVLGGGAPNLTLMSGALLALHDYGLTFDAVSMSGAGAVVGLCLSGPERIDPGGSASEHDELRCLRCDLFTPSDEL